MKKDKHLKFQNPPNIHKSIFYAQRRNLYLFMVLLLGAFQACKVADSGKINREILDNQPLATLGEDTVRAGDFLYAFRNNNVVPMDTAGMETGNINRDSINQYLDLYLNFRLKIKAAEDSGMHKTENFKEELSGYKEELAEPYLTSTRINKKMVKQAYQHLKSEVNASHILIRVDEDASPADTLAAYQLLDSLADKIRQGAASFEAMAKKYSEDPSASGNGGELGYFTAFQMVYPFEKVVYKLEEGQISEPIRTRFGYHIIKLNDKRPARDRVKVAHIMIREQKNGSNNEEGTANERIMDIYQQLKNGGDWDKLCREYSEDPSTKNKGGSLPYISTGMMMDNFEETAYSLQENGAISEPIQTPYGWHILKLEDRKPLPGFEKMKPQIERQISESSRSAVIDQKLISSLKKDLDFQSYQDSINALLQSINFQPEKDTLEVNGVNANATLFTINRQIYKGQDFIDFFLNNYDLKNADEQLSDELLESYYKDFVANSLKSYEREHLKALNPSYKRVIEEYRNGILLFNIMEKQVWSKATKDSVGLYNYFRSNYKEYNTKKRIVATIFSGKNQEVINKVNREIGNFSEILPDPIVKSLEEKYNKDDQNAFKVIQGNYTSDSINHYPVSGILKTVTWEKGQYMIEKNDRKYQVHVHRMIPEGVRNFENVKGLVMADYQKHLEEKWITDLRRRYPVKVNQEVLEKIIKNIENLL